MSTPTSLSGGQPLRSALKSDDQVERSPSLATASKAVSIAEPDLVTLDDSAPKKQFTAGLGKKLSGRPPVSPRSSSRTSLPGQAAAEDLSLPDPALGDEAVHHRHRVDRLSEKLLSQVSEWIEHEKTKSATRRRAVKALTRRKSPEAKHESHVPPENGRPRSPSQDSESSEVSLDRLQRIVEEGIAALGLKSIPSFNPRSSFGGRSSTRSRRSSKSLQLHRTASSDTDYYDGDVLVPSCDVVLDNSATVLASDGAVSTPGRSDEKRKHAYIAFKNEIIRLAHTLKLKGWRRVPLDGGESIWVERLSGALTNAVYQVTPPAGLAGQSHGEKKTPTKVLLRIYGPQVEHLIDREKELSVLRRLARKRIGPRLLGTFTNGRFEQFFNATTLTAANLREPETSKQIAKRMRELHDGIELLNEERQGGPAVWDNWDRWVDKVEVVMRFLDGQILAGEGVGASSTGGAGDAWKARGLICGVEWPRFKAMVEKSRQLVKEYYGDRWRLCEKLVFAHNDTQYGNILRIRPDDEKSPLLQPANEHKQLVVIDFEYAAANLPGLEFANHFTEWTYNYHDPVAPHLCHAERYPTPEQQQRFIAAYVNHRPQHTASGSPRDTPLATPTSGTPISGTPALHSTSSSSSIVEFMLDARVPPGGWKEEERKQQEEIEGRVRELMEETRLWRVANSAQWVAWGIIQAKIPGLALALSPRSEAILGGPESAAALSGQGGGNTEGGGSAGAEEGVGGEGAAADGKDDSAADAPEFDYLAYAQERALFFWGDCVLMGLVRRDELPDELRARIKLVDY